MFEQRIHTFYNYRSIYVLQPNVLRVPYLDIQQYCQYIILSVIAGLEKFRCYSMELLNIVVVLIEYVEMTQLFH